MRDRVSQKGVLCLHTRSWLCHAHSSEWKASMSVSAAQSTPQSSFPFEEVMSLLHRKDILHLLCGAEAGLDPSLSRFLPQHPELQGCGGAWGLHIALHLLSMYYTRLVASRSCLG